MTPGRSRRRQGEEVPGSVLSRVANAIQWERYRIRRDWRRNRGRYQTLSTFANSSQDRHGLQPGNFLRHRLGPCWLCFPCLSYLVSTDSWLYGRKHGDGRTNSKQKTSDEQLLPVLAYSRSNDSEEAENG